MPGMTPESNVPWWAPGRPFIISDPNKLTYFARANAIRAGVMNMPGSLSGVAVGDGGDWANPYGTEDGPGADRAFTSAFSFYNPTVDTGNRTVPRSIEEASYAAGSGAVEMPSGGNTVDSFFNALNRLISGPQSAPQVYKPAPSPWPWVIGVGAVGIGLLYLTKRKRA